MPVSISWISLRTMWPAVLMLLVLVLLPVARSAEAAMAIAALAGLIGLVRAPRGFWRHCRLAVIVFGCYWLAAAISAPDAIAPEKSWSTVFVLLRFFPFVIFSCLYLRDPAIWPRMMLASGMIVTLWLLDAWVQIITGFSIAGVSHPRYLSGIFGAGNLKLGLMLAILSPFVFAAAQARWGWRGVALAFVLALVPILLAGERAAWLMYAVVSLVFAWRLTRTPFQFAGSAAVAALVAVLSISVAMHQSPAFAERVQKSLLAIQGSEQAVDTAGAGRVRIWRTALRMIADHPISGVGVRGFRYAYPKYAEPADAFINRDTDEGASHAHSLVLEVLSETGAIGLLLWIIAAVCALRGWRRADPSARSRAFAPGLALLAMCFPLNTHLAFYSASAWGLLFWWLLALYCAALAPLDEVVGDGA